MTLSPKAALNPHANICKILSTQLVYHILFYFPFKGVTSLVRIEIVLMSGVFVHCLALYENK